MTDGQGQEYPPIELTQAVGELTIDDLIRHVRPLTATSPVSTSEILEALDEGRRSRDDI